MDPLRIAARVVCAYVVLLGLVRVSGKRTVKQGSPFDFTLALVLGDLIDDFLWAEAATSEFVVACVVLVSAQTLLNTVRSRAGTGRWIGAAR